jgi:cysteine synthase A
MGRLLSSITEKIGNTPLVKLQRVANPSDAAVFGKLESVNPGGSVKDRICLAMILDAEQRGLLKPGATVVEPTSGNTGIGFAMIGAARGYRVILTMPETMSVERIQILKSYGAEVVLTPAAEGMKGAVSRAEAIVGATPGAFMPQQFANPANPDIHRKTTAQEILRDLSAEIHAFVAGVGTGGTITGVGEVLKARYPKMRVVAVEPQGSPVLSGGEAGPHMIQGIGAGFVPQVLNRAVIDEIITVSDEAAYNMSRRLCKEEGLFVGISAGANVWAALKVAQQLGSGHTVVTVLCDTGERYISIQPYFEG